MEAQEVLKVYYYPYSSLKTKARKVEAINNTIRALCQGMMSSMYEFNGVGLAANQVGLLVRVIVIDTDQAGARGDMRTTKEYQHSGVPVAMINPEIIWSSEETFFADEGCLSLPGVTVNVKRYKSVRVKYLTLHGQEHEVEADGLFGECIQHEIEHLDGITLMEHLSPLKRDIMMKKMTKKIQTLQYRKGLVIVDGRAVYRNFI